MSDIPLPIGELNFDDNDYTQRKTQEQEPEKIIISFKAIGNAPILRVSKFRVKREGTNFDYIRTFLRRQLSPSPPPGSGGDGSRRNISLFLYLNSSFSPRPDESLENLYRCFATSDGQLVISYSITEAWG